jgi:hypothetical protein
MLQATRNAPFAAWLLVASALLRFATARSLR